MEHVGLTEKEAKEKLLRYGFNEIDSSSKNSAFSILKRQVINNYVIYLLSATFFISLFLGKTITSHVILFVIFTVIGVSFVQEFKAEKSIEALKQMIMPVSIVMREGKEKEIYTKELVPGDVILLRVGERIPADCLTLEQKDLKVDESMLTGESKEIRKEAAGSSEKYSEVNILFMGTFVTQGKAYAKVLHTGMNTKFGKIAKMMSSAEKQLPLQEKVNKLINVMVISAIIASVLTGIFILLRNMPFTYSMFLETLIIVLAICVAAMPEGFPVVLVTVLASGAHRMAKKNAIVGRMSIIETLGETTVICSDKTGTITTGEMTAKKIILNNRTIEVSGAGYEGNGTFMENGKIISHLKDRQLNLILKASVLCNDSRIERKGTDKEYNVFGNFTEVSLLVLGAKADIYREDFKSKRIDEIPFSSERKMMSVLVNDNGFKHIYSKGAPSVLLKKCTHIQKGERIVKLTKNEREFIVKENLAATSSAFRTIALAYKKTASANLKTFEENLVFLGIIAMDDPPRDGVKESILTCESAGIKVKMITGDSRQTAKAIASQIGLSCETLDGEEIDRMTDDELSKVVNNVSIFARVRPEHKLRIVKALKQNNEIVTMTGDGVNDAPALKEAHIGVAMGASGTDASRAASDLILKDNHFSTIVDAIKEGRTIFANIQKFTAFQVSINVAQVSILLLSAMFGFPLPLVAIQILLMNIVSDEMIALTLAFNSYSKDVMAAKPRKKNNIINKPLFVMVMVSGIIMTAGALFTFFYVNTIKGESEQVARTAVFVMMSFFAITNAFVFRSFRKPVFRHKIAANKYLIYVSILVLIGTFAAVYSPLNSVFEMTSISGSYWLLALGVSLILIIIFDILKVIKGNNMFLDINEFH